MNLAQSRLILSARIYYAMGPKWLMNVAVLIAEYDKFARLEESPVPRSVESGSTAVKYCKASVAYVIHWSVVCEHKSR